MDKKTEQAMTTLPVKVLDALIEQPNTGVTDGVYASIKGFMLDGDGVVGKSPLLLRIRRLDIIDSCPRETEIMFNDDMSIASMRTYYS